MTKQNQTAMITASSSVASEQAFEFNSIEKPRDDSSSKSINFVPSRGPKLPWQQ